MTDWPVLRLEEDNDRLREQVARLTAARAGLVDALADSEFVYTEPYDVARAALGEDG
jgi:hypothetical protein